MDIMSKILAVIFSVITALGIIPRTVPKIVVLDDLKADTMVGDASSIKKIIDEEEKREN